VTYEGQAAIELEAQSDPNETNFYEFSIGETLLDPRPVIQSVVREYQNAIPVPTISARFHNAVVQSCLNMCKIIRSETGIKTVALSGGVWQNIFLFSKTFQLLGKHDFKVLTHKLLPTNDACISMGQAAIAARQFS
jgi:hydrogenase maturation protein HypF